MKILFLAANPVDVITRLRPEEEIREISQKIFTGTHWNQLELVSAWAVRAGDLQALLLTHKPDIVHFSGHCSQTSGIILEDEVGNRKIVSRKALCDLFAILKNNIRIVVLNACYAKEQAQALSTTVDFTIGMSAAIGDKDAITFAACFYQSLAFGCSVQDAFNLAVNQLELEGSDVAHVPELLTRDGANAAQTQIIAVSRTPIEVEGISVLSRDRNFTIEEFADSTFIPEGGSNVAIPGSAGKEQGELRPAVLLPPMVISISIIFITDVLRRFLSSEGGWLYMASTIVQIVFIILAIMAACLAGILWMNPASPLARRAARLIIFNEPQKPLRATISMGLVLIITFGLWLSLPIFARYYNERGIRAQYNENPDLSRARESYQMALKLKPGYAQAHYNLATVYEDLQDEKAIEEYLLAIRYDSRIYPAYNNLARLYLRRGENNDYENALRILNQALDISPQDEGVQYSLNKNLGWANWKLKNYASSEMYLRRAISLQDEEGGAAAHCLLVYVLKELGKAGVEDECFYCVTLAPGEKDVEEKWTSDAQDYLIKGGRN
jgi:hypothetical protein